jgi:hypothetical protein
MDHMVAASPVTSERLPLDGRGFRTRSGLLSLWTPSPQIVLVKFEGHGDAAFVPPVVDVFEFALAATGSMSLFFDAVLLRSYDSRLRTELTTRFARDLDRIAELHVLARSRVVAMGVSVANLALRGRIEPHVDRATFLLAMDRALAAARVVGFSSQVLVSLEAPSFE